MESRSGENTMKVAFLDCVSGISGDMTLGALVDVGVDLATIQQGIDSLGLPSCRLVREEVKKKGFRATQITVEHEPEHAHRHLHHITGMIDGSTLTDRQKDLARKIFTRLGEAEAKVHGTTLQKVHFHEVGAVDSIADIVGAAIGWDLLGADRIYCSPIPTGRGFIQIAHGRCSIPAPATAELLSGIPLAACEIESELTTPTGAAIVATLVDQFGPMPAMTIDRIGCGAGQRDLDEQGNILRLVVGEVECAVGSEQVWMLETDLDDISGEQVGYCRSLLAEAGALDVYATSIQMKKNRPGTKLSVLCQSADISRLQEILFRETTTLGVRRWQLYRDTLERTIISVETPWGPIEGKVVTLADGTRRFSPEFESCQKVARQQEIRLQEVYETARKGFEESSS